MSTPCCLATRSHLAPSSSRTHPTPRTAACLSHPTAPTTLSPRNLPLCATPRRDPSPCRVCTLRRMTPGALAHSLGSGGQDIRGQAWRFWACLGQLLILYVRAMQARPHTWTHQPYLADTPCIGTYPLFCVIVPTSFTHGHDRPEAAGEQEPTGAAPAGPPEVSDSAVAVQICSHA